MKKVLSYETKKGKRVAIAATLKPPTSLSLNTSPKRQFNSPKTSINSNLFNQTTSIVNASIQSSDIDGVPVFIDPNSHIPMPKSPLSNRSILAMT